MADFTVSDITEHRVGQGHARSALTRLWELAPTSGQYEALEIHGQSFRIGTERKIVLLFIELSTFTDE